MNGQTQDLVSVVIPVYNAAKFLPETIESVINQTYSSWELILVNDAATDGSDEIARRYASQFPDKIFYLEHENRVNRGITATRNAGIRQSRGAYLAFLDHDDLWMPLKLERQLEIFQQHPTASLIYGSSEWWHGWTGKPEDAARDWRDMVEERGVKPDTLYEPPTALVNFLRDGAAVPCPSSILTRREMVLAINGFEEEFKGVFQPYEDQAFFAKAFLHSPVFVESGCWTKYRRHPDSAYHLSQVRNEEQDNRLFFLNWLKRYLISQNVTDADVWSALELALLPYKRKTVVHYLERARENPVGAAKSGAKVIARRALPVPARRWLRERLKGEVEDAPPVGRVKFGDLRRTTPFSRNFGFERGRPVDRYYIEEFLQRHATDVKGRVLEIGDDSYTRKFGGSRVTSNDILHVIENHPRATFIGDITDAPQIPSNAFDCVIFTQTLHLIYDMPAALRTLHRILKPGGVLLVTAPGISHIDFHEWQTSWYWALTQFSMDKLFEETFASGNFTIEVHGNVLVATSFLYGVVAEELTRQELEHTDLQYPVTIAVRAIKSDEAARSEAMQIADDKAKLAA